MESEGFDRWSSHALPLVFNSRPNRKRWTWPYLDLTLHMDGYSSNTSAGGREAFLMAQAHSSTKERPAHYKLPVYSHVLPVHNSLPSLPVFSLKGTPFLCSPDLPVVLLQLVCPRWQFFLDIRINPSLAGEVTGSVCF